MSKKEIILRTIQNYYEEYHLMPTIREVMNILNYKSTNSVYRYIKELKSDGYLTSNNPQKKLELISMTNFPPTLKAIKVLNNKEILYLNLEKNKNYIIFQIHNNYFNNLYIKNNDYLIIEKKEKLNDGNLGLFIINNKYRVMLYSYIDGFYILNDIEKEVLYKVNIIGKVVGIYRKSI